MGTVTPAITGLESHQQLVRGLLAGQAFATAAADRRLIETHISSLVLEGGHAWKLRKPLSLPFLDFSTADRRRADCEEELRLNRRTAAALYLDVQPVCGPLDDPRVGAPCPEATAIDWVLRMRRFDPDQTLDHRAARGELGRAEVDALAAEIARFHLALPSSAPEWGAPEAVCRWVQGNAQTLVSTLEGVPDQARVQALEAWSRAQCERLAPALAQRAAQGWVREGHGDLHLANIVWFEGRPMPFDAIEFNPGLRHVDLVSDVAFTFMDLWRRCGPGLAWRFVSAWAEALDDRGGLALLPFYATYRALVRLLVALMRVQQGQDAARADVLAQLDLAETLARLPRTPPRLVMTSGLSGSGKSTVALGLVEALGAIRIRSDVERKRLAGLAPTQRPGVAQQAGLYGAEASRATYGRLATLARELLQAGLNVVVDAAFLRRTERDAMRTLATQCKAQVSLVQCTAPDEVLVARLQRRQQDNRDPSDADARVLALQQQWSEPAGPDEEALVFDTATDLGELDRRCADLARRLQA